MIPICFTLGTRPEAIKLAPVIRTFQASSKFTTQVVLTGQHREMVAQVMEIFGLKADRDLDIMQHQQTLTDITQRSLQGLEKLFQEIAPQLVIVQGDTTTAFAAALAAFYQQIPIGHVEAGLRTDNIYNPFPEEANRRLISQITQLHFAPTSLAVENLHKSGVTGEIYETGNTVIDALLTVAKSQPACDIPGLDWTKYRIILATVHRRENWGEPLQNIAAATSIACRLRPDETTRSTSCPWPSRKNASPASCPRLYRALSASMTTATRALRPFAALKSARMRLPRVDSSAV